MTEPTCPHCGSTKVIGVVLRGTYDGVLYWVCQDCGRTFHRWPGNHRLHWVAQRAMDEEGGHE